MKIRKLVTVIAAALLTTAFVPTSSAQDNTGSAQDGIEVITIIGKRPAPTAAAVCVKEVMARITADGQHSDGKFSGQTPDSPGASMISLRRDIRHCIEQATASTAAQI